MALSDGPDSSAKGERQFKPEWLAWDEALAALTFEAEREWVRRAKKMIKGNFSAIVIPSDRKERSD